jgi:epoxyqueuosine reductase
MDAAPPSETDDPVALARAIKSWGRTLGFQQVGITRTELGQDEAHLERWLALGRHGDMGWMARHGRRRSRPAALVPGTVTVISVRMDYLPPAVADAWSVMADPTLGFVSRYALGRDYHKVLRRRLQRLADRIEETVGPFGYRAFVDSAPVLEKALARNAGLGWIGKHTNLINRRAGSWFFLGELYTDLPLPPDPPASEHCGTCRACLDACPTDAIVAPFELDARRCISYLTIELEGSIPPPLRPLMGNRVYGCDDCQLVCPWNKFAALSVEPDFAARHGLDAPGLIELFAWDEETFLARTAGSAIRRIGHVRWLRNIAVALGNAPRSDAVRAALAARRDHPSGTVREHVTWALARQAEHPPAGPAPATPTATPAPDD